jgi:DNA-binding NarL/FixJ family response regulator
VYRSNASSLCAPGPQELDELTQREHEPLRHIATGLSNAEIAKEPFISETTVKTHVAHILATLGLRDRIHAVVLAHEIGLLENHSDRSPRDRRPATDARPSI